METYVPILPVPQQSKTVHHMSPTNKCLWTEDETTVQYQSNIYKYKYIHKYKCKHIHKYKCLKTPVETTVQYESHTHICNGESSTPPR